MPPLRFVLLRPRNAENLGAAARAMKNFGWRDWVWVQPEAEDLGPARRLAVHAGDLLEGVRIVDSLEAAVADCVWVVGTSSRRVEGKRRLTPRQVGLEAITRSSGGPVAIVFGDERSGMTNEDVWRCHDLSSVPTFPEQPSINLAQSLLLYGYEARMAAQAPPSEPSARPIPASVEALGALEGALQQLLRAGGFLVHEGRHAMRDLMAPLKRADLSRNEAGLWTAALHRVRRHLPAPADPPEPE